jgi:predicted deacylase
MGIKMNKFITKEIPVSTLPSGDTLSIRKYTMSSNEAGPIVYIQASVHGSELQGNPVICEVLQYLENVDFKGTIHFVPLANPIATNKKQGAYTMGRVNSITGDNWNRNYTNIVKADQKKTGLDLEVFAKKHLNSPIELIKKEFKALLNTSLFNYQNNISEYGQDTNKHHFLTLQLMAASADYVLDLHTGPVATRYVYCAEYSAHKAKDLIFPHYLIIPNEFSKAMDEACFMPWVYLQQAFNKLGKGFEIPFEAYTIELGSEENISFKDAKEDAARILHFLKKRGVITGSPDVNIPKAKICELKDYKTYYANQAGLYDYIAKPGTIVKAGEVLAKILNFNIQNPITCSDFKTELVAKRDCVVINHCPSASVEKGMELFQVMENFNEN